MTTIYFRREKPAHQWMGKQDELVQDISKVVLDCYNSDMNLLIMKENHCKATPFTDQGWGYVWSGARATYGYDQGKVMFEVKVRRKRLHPSLLKIPQKMVYIAALKFSKTNQK